MSDPAGDRWQRLKTLVAAVTRVSPEARDAWLLDACADDPDLKADVESLLAAREAADGFLETPALHVPEVARTVLDALDRERLRGRRIGPYSIVRMLGRGGMGVVYLATRADGAFDKTVAIKLVTGGGLDSQLLARFADERRILAGLDHPNIARLLDGGTTEDGTPYVVMEYVEGEPIDMYCRARRLSIRGRLELFRKVCAAVEYSHRRLVVHRDIKAGNILVTTDGTPKLLDFGIAKLLEPAADAPQRTATLFRALTPESASPEQLRGEPVTVATDVYSLGVLLYRLLTDEGPYQTLLDTEANITQAICHEQPLAPSARLAASAHADAADRSRAVRGDLDLIVLKALRKEPDRRYGSVQLLAEDVESHLVGRPVAAAPDSWHYRAGKFARRHRLGLAAAAATLTAIVAGTSIAVYQARVARREAAIAEAQHMRAERRFNDVRQLANSLIFDIHDSIRDLPGATPAKKLLIDRALQYLNSLSNEASGDVSLQRDLAAAYERVGTVQGDYLENNLGDAEGTLASYKRVLEIRTRIHENSRDWNDELALAQAHRLVAHQLWANGNPGDARAPIERAIAISERLRAEHPNEPTVLHELAFDYEVSARNGYPGDPLERAKIIENYRQALAVDETALELEPDDVRRLHDYSIDVSNLAGRLEASDPQEALKDYQKMLDIDLKVARLSPDVRYRRSVALDYGSIASAYDDLGDYPRALDNNRKDLAIYLGLVQADPRNVLLRQGLAITYANTASTAVRTRDMALALDDSSRALEIMRGLIASAPPNAFQRGIFAAMHIVRGTVLMTLNQADAAIPEIEQARAIYESLAKAGSMNRANVVACDVKLGEAAARAGRDRTAAEYFHETLTIAEPLISTEPPDLDALYAVADAYSGLGDLASRSARQSDGGAARRKSRWIEARDWYQRSLQTWDRIEHPSHTSPNSFQVGDPEDVRRKITTTQAALASVR
jgi:tetratricopeptide (TPR) repeat protein/tRNA A-37 threonylcarbamoyl transferase component Bud32